MNCDAVGDLVIDSVMDELDDATARALDEHVETCAACREEAAAIRGLWQDLANAEAPPLPPGALVRFGRRVERRRPTIGRRLLQVAAAVALLVTGAVSGRFIAGADRADGASAAPGTEFLLLIRGAELNPSRSEAQLVAEYSRWAGGLAEQGRLVSAEKLADDGGAWVSTDPRSLEQRMRDPVEGFFLVKAESYDQAVALARGHPHVAYGGTIEVRAVERP